MVFVDFDNQVGGGVAGMVGATNMGCGVWGQLPTSAVWGILYDFKVLFVCVKKHLDFLSYCDKILIVIGSRIAHRAQPHFASATLRVAGHTDGVVIAKECHT